MGTQCCWELSKALWEDILAFILLGFIPITYPRLGYGKFSGWPVLCCMQPTKGRKDRCLRLKISYCFQTFNIFSLPNLLIVLYVLWRYSSWAIPWTLRPNCSPTFLKFHPRPDHIVYNIFSWFSLSFICTHRCKDLGFHICALFMEHIVFFFFAVFLCSSFLSKDFYSQWHASCYLRIFLWLLLSQVWYQKLIE